MTQPMGAGPMFSTAGRIVNGTVSSSAVLLVAAKAAVLGPEAAALAAVLSGVVLTTVGSASRDKLEKDGEAMPLWKSLLLQIAAKLG